jgi:hypothetical protein
LRIQLVEQRVGVSRPERLAADQQAVVQRAVEGVDGDLDVEVVAQLATRLPAHEDLARGGSAAGDEALAQRARELGVVLTQATKGRKS